MILPIVLHPDPRLRKLCMPVFDVAEVAELVGDMFETMYAAPGRGLAAPQVGVSKRLFVMDAGWKTGDKTPITMINPEILSRSPELQTGEEGCLSIPDQPVTVDRPARIEVMWLAPDGTQNRGAFDGFEAACICHEIDHLDGVLILDHVAAA